MKPEGCQMKKENYLILTEEMIREGATTGKTKRGDTYHAWRKKQIQLLAGRPYKGWIQDTIGKEIPGEIYMLFARLNPKSPLYQTIINNNQLAA
ncbi:MAG: hypothetical protein HOL04_09175 [Gammaproteobacteria bacterium]|jgi:hypothetical protein|nr:hypothetical protein [Gammaproteobacteria bacterium]MBT5361900.1 hypothetical protein [Gammaproteobacteria bacterium]MBT5745201.1 hypothetical protein [Gammaproteobacteria bacterium]MBT7023140.1 hypothetical protein [Gammaproteobacteria bacterium]MBT7229484.1 hypothetical protein [Gammaproteobacteria bacterium]